MSIARTLRRLLRRTGDDRGSIAMEAAIILPLMATWFVASFVYFDVYRKDNVAVKATYTIGDILSRQTEVDDDFIDGLHLLSAFLSDSSPDDTWLRVSSISFNGTSYWVEWSYTSNNQHQLTIADLPRISSMVPAMAADETVILTETNIYYRPLFKVGIAEQYIRHATVTRPRFAPRLGHATHDMVGSGQGDLCDETSLCF